jgi:uncharacterized protein YidB (DUF937 family)
MGLLDVLNGMRNGPRGGPSGGQADASSGGMSPITMAILALLAYKGIKHFGGAQAPQPGGNPARLPDGSAAAPGGGGLGDILGGLLGGGAAPGGRNAAPGGGGLGDILGGLLGGGAAPGNRMAPGAAPSGLGGLGGLLAGGAAGSILSGGLGGLLNQFQQSGQSEAANSWVSRGPNRDISESDLARSIGTDDIEALARHTGLSREDLLSGLRRELPGAIDDLTPDGRVPTAEEISQRV